MRAAAVVALLLAALCIASAARIPDDDLSNIKETLSSIGSVQVGAADLLSSCGCCCCCCASCLVHVHWQQDLTG
jgi:hypothetical protein